MVASTFNRLGVNIASVIIGAMFFLMIIALIDAFRALTDHVFFDDGQDGVRSEHVYLKKMLSAILITAISGFIIIIVYTLSAGSDVGKDSSLLEDKDMIPYYADPGAQNIGVASSHIGIVAVASTSAIVK